MPSKASKQASRAGARDKGKAMEADDDTTSAAAAAAATTASGPARIKVEPGHNSTSPYDVDLSPAAATVASTAESIARENDGLSDDTEHGGSLAELEDDPVIKTYDVVINNTLDELLHLFQYPNRLKNKPYDAQNGTAPLGARWKERSGLVELDVPVNTSSNYDREKGVQWGKAMRAAKVKGMASAGPGNYAASNASSDGAGKKRKLAGANSPWGGSEHDGGEDVPMRDADVDWNTARARGMVLDKQTLGAKIQPSKTSYFIGTWKEDCLHLNKLHDVVQLRPQFNHIDKALEQERATQKALKDSINPTTAKIQEARAVNLTVKASAEGRFGEIRAVGNSETIWNDIRKEEDEQWREIVWVDQDNGDAWDLYGKMTEDMDTQLCSTTSKDGYLHACSAETDDVN